MDLGALDAQGYYELLRKLEGTGYCKDDDSVRGTELMAVATIAAMCTAKLQDAFANLFLTSSTSGLDLRERVLYLVQLSSLPVEERRARLIAFQQGSWLVEARLDNAFGTYLADFTGTTQRPADLETTQQRSALGAAFLVARREPAATAKQQIRDLSPVLDRGLPVRAISGGVSQRDATWGDALKPAGIALTPAVTIPAQTLARTAPIPFHPGSSMSREEWVELQSMLCFKSHGFSIDQTKQGRTVMCLNVSISAASSSLIDGPTANSSIDWSNRLIQAYGVVSTTTLTDLTANTKAEHVWLAPSKTGALGAAYTHTLIGSDQSATNSTATLDMDASGNLRLNNTGGSTVFVTLMIRCSPQYSPGSSTDTQPWMNSTQANHADMAELFAAQVVTNAAVGKFAAVNAGALRRVCYSGPLVKVPTEGIPQGVTLDTSVDWRNRYVLVVPLVTLSGGTGIDNTYPVPSVDGMLTIPIFQYPRVAAPRLFYTGSGVAMGSATQQPYQMPANGVIGDGPFWLFSDTSGALCIEMKATDSTSDSGAWMGLIIASDPTDGSSVTTPAPVHATQVQSHDIECVQTLGTYQQGRQGNVPRRLLTDAAPKLAPTCAPLGVIGEGAFPIRPVSWMISERLGATDDGSYEQRQSIFGQRRRMVSLAVPNGTSRMVDDYNLADQMGLAINDQIDMRDRILWIEGRWSPTDITVQAASQASDSAAPQFSIAMYTGPYARQYNVGGYWVFGQRVTVSLAPISGVDIEFVFSRAGTQKGLHSVVRVNNSTGASAYLNLVWEVSGKLGLCDSRNYGTA